MVSFSISNRIWLILFIVSITTFLVYFSLTQFKTDKQIETNTVKINESLAREEQTKFIADRQDIIIETIINRTDHDLGLDKAIIDKANQALNMGKEINNKLDILLGNNTK